MNNRLRGIASERGFSLLEVLVAFTILALAVATILSLFASGLRNTAVAADYARALTLAESRLARVQGRGVTRLESGANEGSMGEFTWHTRIYPYDASGSHPNRTRLYQIDVTVQWGEGERRRTVQLSTLQNGLSP